MRSETEKTEQGKGGHRRTQKKESIRRRDGNSGFSFEKESKRKQERMRKEEMERKERNKRRVRGVLLEGGSERAEGKERREKCRFYTYSL